MRPQTGNVDVAFVIALFLCLVLGSGLNAQQTPSAQEPPLTNQDVVKMCKLGLGDDVVIAKINQAPQVQFQLDVDSLAALKEQGVSKAVIEAMLKRSSAAPAAPEPRPGGSSAGLKALTGGEEEEGVWLQTSQGRVRLESVLGDQSVTFAYMVSLIFLDFPGLQAQVRTSDRRPSILVRMSKNPRGRVFLVRAEPDKDDNVRSVKVGKASPFGRKSWNSPDADWTIDCDFREVEPGLWQMTPKADLKPGEYGLLFRGGFLGTLAATQAELFDFGVD